MRKRYLIMTISIIVAIFLIGTGSYVYKFKSLIPEMFRLNATLQSEGYYMGEFEFKMLGSGYYLDKGQYTTAYTRLNQLYKQLKSRDGLIKVPKFFNKKEELEFYLNLQNPKTGAFMDDSYPLFTYIGPTLNVIEHLELLAKETGQPLHLKYPLRFLDQINTAEKLKVFLDDLSTVGRIGSKLPKTSYIEIAELTYYNDLERNNLYTFSPEWKKELLKWLYENQDSKTGYWGPRLRSSEKLLNSGDLGPTFHIIKLFVDDQGNNIYPEFPLRYKDEMFLTTIKKLSDPMPADANLGELHDWSFTRQQGLNLLEGYLWSSASLENKSTVKKLMKDLLINRYEKFYKKDEGSFSLYPGSEHCDLDGTGTALGILDQVGALSSDKQKFLWGSPEKNIVDLGVHEVTELTESDFDLIKNSQDINSIRLYENNPGQDNYQSNVVSITYPKKTQVLDVMDLLPQINHWINTTSQNMGNWTSKEEIIQKLATVKVQAVPVSDGDVPLNIANEVLKKNHELIVIGFDVLQMPKYKMIVRIK